jgi:type II secretory pathway pseudopilin PulG
MEPNPYEAPQTAEKPLAPAPSRWRFTLLQLLVGVAAIGLAIALLLPASRRAREPARRMQCGNNLKQIGIALHTYADEYGCLPPAYTVDAEGKPLHSWRTLILPFLEQNRLYEKIDLAKPWDDPANRLAYEAEFGGNVYQCPSAGLPKGHTMYLAVVARGGCFQSTRPRALAEITDDHNQTLMVIETPPQQAVHWMSPNDAAEELVLNAAAAEKRAHPSGTQGLFVNGRVSFLSAKTKPETLRALISIAGKEFAEIDD